MRTTVTALILFKNEKEFLERCVSTAVEGADRVVLVDNESTDGSTEIAKKLAENYPSLIEYHFMPSDFDTATEFATRNKCLQFVHTEWVMILDADQLLSDGWRRAIKKQLLDKSIDAIRFKYEHYVGSYEHIHIEFYEKQQGLRERPDIPLWQTVLFRMRPDLECMPACRADKRFKEFHHASFDPSMVGRKFYNCSQATCFHYGFSKRDMMFMAKYRIHRGDYGHTAEDKEWRLKELDKTGNPFRFIGHVTRVGYGKDHVPTIMKYKFGTTYKLELDKGGYIQSRTEIATGIKL